MGWRDLWERGLVGLERFMEKRTIGGLKRFVGERIRWVGEIYGRED